MLLCGAPRAGKTILGKRILTILPPMISGPLMDRIDTQVDVPAVPYKDLTGGPMAESSETIRHRVIAARNRGTPRGRSSPWIAGRALEDNGGRTMGNGEEGLIWR